MDKLLSTECEPVTDLGDIFGQSMETPLTEIRMVGRLMKGYRSSSENATFIKALESQTWPRRCQQR